MPKYSDICAAARAGNLAAVQDMVQADPQAVFTTNKYGFNGLHEALAADNCGNVNFELVRFWSMQVARSIKSAKAATRVRRFG